MARRTYGNPDLLPPPKVQEEKSNRYIIIPTDLHERLKEEAAARGYGYREFARLILERALEGK